VSQTQYARLLLKVAQFYFAVLHFLVFAKTKKWLSYSQPFYAIILC